MIEIHHFGCGIRPVGVLNKYVYFKIESQCPRICFHCWPGEVAGTDNYTLNFTGINFEGSLSVPLIYDVSRYSRSLRKLKNVYFIHDAICKVMAVYLNCVVLLLSI